MCKVGKRCASHARPALAKAIQAVDAAKQKLLNAPPNSDERDRAWSAYVEAVHEAGKAEISYHSTRAGFAALVGDGNTAVESRADKGYSTLVHHAHITNIESSMRDSGSKYVRDNTFSTGEYVSDNKPLEVFYRSAGRGKSVTHMILSDANGNRTYETYASKELSRGRHTMRFVSRENGGTTYVYDGQPVYVSYRVESGKTTMVFHPGREISADQHKNIQELGTLINREAGLAHKVEVETSGRGFSSYAVDMSRAPERKKSFMDIM